MRDFIQRCRAVGAAILALVMVIPALLAWRRGRDDHGADDGSGSEE